MCQSLRALPAAWLTHACAAWPGLLHVLQGMPLYSKVLSSGASTLSWATTTTPYRLGAQYMYPHVQVRPRSCGTPIRVQCSQAAAAQCQCVCSGAAWHAPVLTGPVPGACCLLPPPPLHLRSPWPTPPSAG